MKETINILCKHKLFGGMHKELSAKEECKQWSVHKIERNVHFCDVAAIVSA